MNDDIDVSILSGQQIEGLLKQLTDQGYRFTRQYAPRDVYFGHPAGTHLLKGIILDTETTGTDFENDHIIGLGMVAFEYCPASGLIGKVLGTFNQLEYPGGPIPPSSTGIHHITDEMVAGKSIDDDDVEAFVAGTSIVIAHNAHFDRPFTERRFPIFASLPWACTYQQIPWQFEGFGSGGLEYLAYKSGIHFTGHRASVDCHALLEVLHAAPLASGNSALKTLVDTALLSDFKVSALNSPFDSKDMLKTRRYKWNPYAKVWAGSVSGEMMDDEIAWLKANVYNNRPFKLEVEALDASNRFSNRAGTIKVIEC